MAKSGNTRVNLLYTPQEAEPQKKYLRDLLKQGLVVNGVLKLKGKLLAEYLILEAARMLDPDFPQDFGSSDTTEEAPKEPKPRKVIAPNGQASKPGASATNAGQKPPRQRMAPPSQQQLQDAKDALGLK
jgi:hypothetical protein